MPTRANTWIRAARALACAGGVAASSSGSSARADEVIASEGDRAAALKEVGDAAMRAGSFEGAFYAYRDAYAVDPQPALLYNMARAQQQTHRYAEALRKIEQFVEAAPPELKARVPHLDDLVAEIRAHVATLMVRTSVAGARVALRGRYVATTPMRATVRATEGRARIEVSSPGYLTAQRDVTLEGGRLATVDVTLVPASAPLAAAPPAPERAAPLAPDAGAAPGSGPVTDKWWFWTGIGVAVIGGVGLTAVLTTHHAPPRAASTSGALVSF